jgi:alpha-L-fucosidase
LGAVTEKGNKIYLHLLKQKEDKWMIKIPVAFKTAKYFKSGAPVRFQKLDNNFVVFDINPAQRDELDTVIELEK